MRRMAEAVTLSIRTNGLLEGSDGLPQLLLGDLKDVPKAQTSLTLNGPRAARAARSGSTAPTRGTTLASSTSPPRSPKNVGSHGPMTDAENCSIRSSLPFKSSRLVRTATDGFRKLTRTSTSGSGCLLWQKTPVSGRRMSGLTTLR
jgi:hypothetical protein